MPCTTIFLVHPSQLSSIVLILLRLIMGESSSYMLPSPRWVLRERGTYMVEVLLRPEFTHPSRINSSAATT